MGEVLLPLSSAQPSPAAHDHLCTIDHLPHASHHSTLAATCPPLKAPHASRASARWASYSGQTSYFLQISVHEQVTELLQNLQASSQHYTCSEDDADHRQHECSGLAGARLGAGHQIAPLERYGYSILLHRRGLPACHMHSKRCRAALSSGSAGTLPSTLHGSLLICLRHDQESQCKT